MVMKQATKYHEELNTEDECEYSEDWLQKFKKHHGIKYLKVCGEKVSADYDAAEHYIDEFAKMVPDENLSPEQIYNADETALYWLSTLPLSHPVACIVLSTNVKIYAKNLPLRNPKSVSSQGFRIRDCEPVIIFKVKIITES